MNLTEKLVIVITLLLFIAVAHITARYSDDIVQVFESLRGIEGISAYISGEIAATVIAPLSFLPAVPIAVKLWGPFMTALLTLAGGMAGSMIAFFIARRFGTPVVRRFVSIEKLERLARIEDHIPPHNLFWSIVVLRLALPIDILSYVLGLFTHISAGAYARATLIALVPFSFLFAYISNISVIFQILAFVAGMATLSYAYTYLKRKHFLGEPALSEASE